MSDAVKHARRAGRAAPVAIVMGAMLISGCFNAGTSVKQAMTSGAPGSPAVAHVPDEGVPSATVAPQVPAAAAVTAKHASFDLDNPAVGSTVAAFQTQLRDFFHGAFLRSGKYVPTMASMLVNQGLPAELAYLPLIESGYRTQAVSSAGAAGPWQFIPETGKRYGLRIDALVDERRDPIKSTEAAAQYLKDLHEMFGDWELSLAAYNSGEWRVARILADTGAPDFWAMRNGGYLPSETSQYVPRFLAAVRIAKAPHEYGFAAPLGEAFHFETVHVDRQLSLRTAAGLCGVATSELVELNPALRRGITPSGYALRVPNGAAEPLRAALASYVEPARASVRVARATRKASSRTVVTKAESRRRVVSRGAPPAPTARESRKQSRRDAAPGATAPRSKAPTVSRAAERPSRRDAPVLRVAREASPFIKPAKSPPKARRRSS